MTKTFKGLFITILTVGLFFANTAFTHAATATFSISPSKGTVKTGNSFTMDVLIDTQSQPVLLARSVLTFDPTLLKVTKAQYNASLFCVYDSTKQSIDNTNGVIALEGFCQSGTSQLYKTDGNPDVFARITFQTKKAGTAVIDWQFSGSDQAFKSVIMQDGSPAFNILSKPSKVTYTIGGTNGGGGVPNTGFFLSWSLITLGIVCILSCVVYVNYMKKNRINSKLRTVVLDD